MIIPVSAKEIYEYVYYKFYKSMIFTTDWGADWRASGVFLGFEAILFYSLVMYYWLINRNGHYFPGYELVLIPGAILFTIDHFLLHSRQQWRVVIEKYDAWPTKKNFRGTLIVWGAIILVIANFLLAIHLYDKVDWTQYQ